MDFNIAEYIRFMSLAIVPFFFAITVHELSHGAAAYMLGDDTAKKLGRLTLNPFAHIDIMGLLFLLTLAASGGVPAAPMLAVLLGLLVLCVPASRLVARVVEKKRHTFTIGGAFFCGLLAALPLILLVSGACARLGRPTLEPWVLLAALAIGGVLGEGLGRLACISFGCCYGRPLDECGHLTRALLAPIAFVFSASTRKAVYEGGLAGVRLVPVQGLTAAVVASDRRISG
jgi:hypothetical protein